MIHSPVLFEEVLHYLTPADGGIYVDGTLGIGGHSRGILDRCGPTGRVIGFDQDEDALVLAKKELFSYEKRFTCIRSNFANIKEVLAELEVPRIDGLLLDLGLSSLQLDTGGRGFSFKASAPLDMRMDKRTPVTAADLINKEEENELADIFFHYGEEQQSRRIAARIVAERKKGPIETTDRLANIVAQAVPKRFHPKKIHVATKVFQALRIAVNHELENLAKILDDAPFILKPGGKMCVISFHSLEDRLVKRRFRENPAYVVLTKKPVTPSKKELLANPRSRSAKLRAAAISDSSSR